MKNIQSITLKDSSKEELLPGFSMDFPYIATCVELDKYIDPTVPWHWHRTVELFYIESGALEYTTPNGKWVFSAGSGGFVNANILHSSRVLHPGDGTVQLLHLFDPVLLAGEHGSRMADLHSRHRLYHLLHQYRFHGFHHPCAMEIPEPQIGNPAISNHPAALQQNDIFFKITQNLSTFRPLSWYNTKKPWKGVLLCPNKSKKRPAPWACWPMCEPTDENHAKRP